MKTVLADGECMSGACTAGAKVIGNRYLIFKNRDLIWPDFLDSVVFDDQVLLVEGADVESGLATGAAFGVNVHGLAAANTTVLISDDAPYDDLMERVLRNCVDIESAHELITTEIEAGFRYQWSNFILADPGQVAAVEIGTDHAEIELDSTMIVRTNHHLLLPTSDVLKRASAEAREAGGPLATSQKRRQIASNILASARSTMDIMDLLSTHSEGRGFDSICRHYPQDPRQNPYQGSTVYSYILEAEWDEDGDLEIRIHVAKGTPCSSTYMDFPVDFSLPPTEKEDLIRSFP